MPTITRHSPDTCGCVVEIETADDGQTQQFLLMNTVCDKHAHLKSTAFASNHVKKSSHVLDLVEEAKTSNLKQVDDQIAKETSNFRKKDLILCRQQVIAFNARLDEEWGELVQPPHAFDQHIHENIKLEQKAKAREVETND